MLKCRKISQFVMLIAGISMICYGAIRGEADAVLSKAIKLCLECVGIG
ncbi:thioredoxin [Dorea formicigenerans]|uniref:Thioredoxin n=1 Tax=Dorea formicigenerans TaxID=39486 RepID=A0A3E4M2Z9_9FIRM|nr:thioredoxin [Dorea formicigenerans]RGI84681.1 thioredoxin [Dorea formicigenerans]RGI88191.1 thioredoxin [Dorea formicigenerans]RGK44006.1 thioredoxin [Dorea formicigenerans]RGK80479.1 thioredoxin [Dorea formicigenerans]